MPKNSQYHIGVAAEAIAAALFARCGYDVSVQYGANQPEYDLLVSRDKRIAKVSVKGSQDGAWGLTQSYLKKGRADYHKAADMWLARHGRQIVMCFVQFQGVGPKEMPRAYLAMTHEVAEHLGRSRAGQGNTILHEDKTWSKRATAAGTTDRLPDSWQFSCERVAEMLDAACV